MQSELRGTLLIQAEAAYLAASSNPTNGRRKAEALIVPARRAGDHEALVVAFWAAGSAARELYQHDDAKRFLAEAVRIAKSTGFRDRLCRVLITRSSMHMELGFPQRARDDIDEARAVASPRTQADVAFAEGLLEDKAGHFSAAVDAYRRALRGIPGDRPLLRIKTLNNLALTIVRSGNYEQANALLDEAIGLASAEGLHAREGIVSESRALVAVESGRPVEALRRYERAEELLTAVGVQLADLYLGKARALLTLRLLDEAAEAAARAVAEVDGRDGGSLMLAEALLPQARIALEQDRLDDAIAAATRAERLFDRQRRRGWRVAAALLRASAQSQRTPDRVTVEELHDIEQTMVAIGDAPGVVEAAFLQGEVLVALGRLRMATAAFGRAAAASHGGPAFLRLQGRTAAARRAELEGDTRRLGHMCRLGLDELAAYRAAVPSAELRARAATYGMTLAEIGLRAALRSRRPEQVWGWLERSSSVVFIDSPRRSEDHLHPLLAQLRALERDFEAIPPDDAVERTASLRSITSLERRIRSASWTRTGQLDDWMRPSIRMLRRVRSDLGDRVLLQFGALADRLHAVAITTDRMLCADIGRLSEIVSSGRQLAFALRRLTQTHGSAAARRAALAGAHAELERLSATLLAPFGAVIASGAEAIIAPPGALVGIPWGSLRLLVDRPVRVVPSAVSWWHSSSRSQTSDRVVLVAGPGLDHAAEEVREVARCHNGSTQLLGVRADSETVRREAAGAGVVHIAAHGRLRSDNPMFSSIQLADGPLTVHDLEGLDASAHHWVLASCDLGRPGPLFGPALEGVLAALLSSGSGAIVAATVSVPDLDTRQLMVELHTSLAAGTSMSEALRRARRAVDASDPTGFVTSVAFSCYGGG